MKNEFLIQALPLSAVESFLSMSDNALKAIGGYWFEADSSPCYPCRVSLQDAQVGERVLAINFTHHNVNSPYRSSGPIFIRANALQAHPAPDEIPTMLRHRQLSVRGYNQDALMQEAEVVDGEQLESHIEKIFDNDAIEYIHIHNAMPGCFNCSVIRA